MATVISGKYQNGQIVLQNSVDWPEGARVEITLLEQQPANVGMTEDEWPTDPAGIAALLERWDALQPLEMTPEEQQEWDAARKAQKDFEIANFEKRARKIEGLFE